MESPLFFNHLVGFAFPAPWAGGQRLCCPGAGTSLRIAAVSSHPAAVPRCDAFCWLSFPLAWFHYTRKVLNPQGFFKKFCD
jgi:hypothetical protein